MESKTQKTLEMVSIVPLRSSIDKLMISESLAVKNFCNEYTKKLDSGLKEEQICEQFIADLAKIAESESDKSVLTEINEAVKENETNIKLANSVHNMSNSSCMFVKPMIESVVVDYMLNKNSENRDNVRVNVSLFESDSNVQDILEALQYEQYEEKNGKALKNVELKESYKEPDVKTYTQEEVDKILSDKVNEMQESAAKEKLTRHTIENHIGLSGAISNILKESNNEKLRVFCEKYISALNEGKAEELLYESFISGISNWNYLSAVDTELSALKDRVSKYKQDIDLKKILEMMAQTGSYYIVPLIEDVVADYALNKNMATRAILLQRLESFEYDPFVRDMEALITRDLSIENTVYLGESVEYLNSQVKTEQVFSPVQYIKESECVFNVKGVYYARKGNSIAKLTRNEVSELNESFKSLCNLVNADNVKFNKELNTISIYDDANKAVITESEIMINDKEVTTDELKSLTEAAINMRSHDAEFYAIVSALNEHYDDIAPIDFVKHIESRDNSGKSCDVFKLKESIFVNTSDNNLGRSTFYRNVNPIQCRKYINEHMEINCGPLFEDELPDQDKIEKGIEDKKKEYQDYIDSLESKKETLLQMKDEGADTDDIDKAIAMIDQELDDTKADFKKYQEDADKYLNGDKDDTDTDSVDPEPDNDDDQNGETDKEDGDNDNDNKEDNETTKDLDPEKETPEEMEKPIDQGNGSDAEVNGDDGDAAEYEFPEEFADVAEYDPDFDVPTEVVKDEKGQSTGVDYGRFQIVNVAYNKNVKTGTSNGKGEVIILIPSVDANGDVHNDTRKVSFYLDPEKKPVINNEYMPLDMYQAIVDAIENDPTTETITPEGASVESDIKISDTVEPDEEEVKVEDNGSIVADEPKEDELKNDDVPAEVPAETEVKDEIKETPAETKEVEKEVAKYPITVGLVPDEIKPITMDDFEKDLDDKMGIEHSKNEANANEILLNIKNKAQAYALRKYFNEWHGYNDEAFNSFMPELQACFDNKPANIDVMPANESVEIKSAKMINEDKKLRVLLPNVQELCEMFGVTCDGNVEQFELIAENKDEEFKIYEKLYEYALAKNGEVEQDVIDILESHKEYGKICESQSHYKLTVPYNNFLEQKLNAKGINVEVVNENMTADISKSDFNKAKKVLESFYGEAAPTEARDFFQFLCENVTITVKDDTTGKTVTINTDDFNGNAAGSAENNDVAADFDDSFKNVTFNTEESLAFKDDEESADDDKDKDKDKEDGEDSEKSNTDNEDTENKESEKTEDGESKEEGSEEEHSEESSEENDGSEDKKSEDEKPKKKFKFKVKKKADESLKENKENAINESQVIDGLKVAEPNVLDLVKCKDGNKGQIIFKQADGNFIVNVSGHTKIYSPSELQLEQVRFDLVECPFKFDEKTLCGIYESFVNCGLFVNNTQVTPNDCRVQLLEWVKAKDEDEIDIILEGQKTKAMKKFIRITESLDDVMDLANYAKATMTYIVEGVVEKNDVLVNIRDYQRYMMVKESYTPVRTLVFDEDGTTHMKNIPGGNLEICESEEYIKPDSNNLLESAVNALS